MNIEAKLAQFQSDMAAIDTSIADLKTRTASDSQAVADITAAETAAATLASRMTTDDQALTVVEGRIASASTRVAAAIAVLDNIDGAPAA